MTTRQAVEFLRRRALFFSRFWFERTSSEYSDVSDLIERYAADHDLVKSALSDEGFSSVATMANYYGVRQMIDAMKRATIQRNKALDELRISRVFSKSCVDQLCAKSEARVKQQEDFDAAEALRRETENFHKALAMANDEILELKKELRETSADALGFIDQLNHQSVWRREYWKDAEKRWLKWAAWLPGVDEDDGRSTSERELDEIEDARGPVTRLCAETNCETKQPVGLERENQCYRPLTSAEFYDLLLRIRDDKPSELHLPGTPVEQALAIYGAALGRR